MRKQLTPHISSRTTILLLVFNFIFWSCGAGGPETPDEISMAFEKLEGSWTFGTTGGITVDGQDISLNFPNFSLSFTDGGYTTLNAGDLFNATGTWEWADQQAGAIDLDDGKNLTISTLTETQFVFSFNFTSGVVANLGNGINGSYIVTVNK